MNQTNSFHMLSESDTSPEDSAENITNPPNYHSSTKDPGKIRILTVNCRSLMSDKKRIDLHNLIETHKPNIIIGTESHLDSTIASSEIFPDNFQNPYRKDRKLGEDGDNNYITTETITKEDCEIKWCKINIAGNQPLHIGAFYRQPNSGSEKIEELEKPINTIVEGSKGNLPKIILGGDYHI